MKDKNGIKIKSGQKILIENSRKDISRTGTVELVDGVLKIKGDTDGKYSSVKNNLDSIWWTNDTPENWLEVINE
jgi:hypothetical protein